MTKRELEVLKVNREFWKSGRPEINVLNELFSIEGKIKALVMSARNGKPGPRKGTSGFTYKENKYAHL